MRKPNGYGSVMKLPGKRRKPWLARITSGWEIVEEDGEFKKKQHFHNIGTYPTRRDAEVALALFNKDPYDTTLSSMTFEEVYNKIMEDTELADNTIKGYKTAYNKCKDLYKKKVAMIKVTDMQLIISRQKTNAPQVQLAKLFSAIYKFSIKNNVCKTDLSRNLELMEEKKEKKGKPFTTDEINRLRAKAAETGLIQYDIALAQIYTGMRITELLTLKCEDIDVEKGIISLKGTKTENAARLVPIHPDLMPIVEKYHGKSTYLFERKGKAISYKYYYASLFDSMEKEGTLEEGHGTHDSRRTFVSCAKRARCADYIIKRIVGHSTHGDMTELYTFVTEDDLINEVKKISFV